MNNFNIDNNSGMLTSRVIQTPQEKVAFIKKFLTNLVYPTFEVASTIGNNINANDINLIMSVFSSIHIDTDLFNLTIVEENAQTKLFEEIYNKNKFYMISSAPVIDKKTNEIAILFELYKNTLTEPLDFITDIRNANGEILGYLYLKELVSLAQKNYKNKFTLANKAKVYLFEHNPNMSTVMRDEAAIALSKMAIEYHVNSMILDNITGNRSSKMNVMNNIEYIKNCSLILYDPQYTYEMSQYDILEKLLDDAVIEFMKFGNDNSQSQDIPNSNIDSPDDSNLSEHLEADDNDSSIEDNDSMETNNESNTADEEADDNTLTRDGPFTSRKNENNNDIDNDDNGFIKITFKSNKHRMFFMKMPPTKENDRYDRLDMQDERGIDNVQNYIDYGLQKLRGTGMQEILQNIGCPLEVDMAWEKELIRYVNNMTNMTNSNKNIATWSKQNIFTRHITTLPGKNPLPESIPILYIIFDQSGSMSNNIIRKINYIIEYFYEKKYDINLFIHDDARTPDEVKVFELRPRASNLAFNDNYKLDNIITSRVMCGGTSHKGAFDLMEVYIKDVSNSNKKYNIQYCFIASDMESDIEGIWKDYEWINLINNNIFGLTPTQGYELPFGKTIYIS